MGLPEKYVVLDIQKRIKEVFPDLNVFIYFDDEQKYFIVSVDNGFYYSDEFQKFVLELKLDYLWKNGIHNCLFIAGEKKSISSPDL